MAVGRITGPLLKANLLRDGVDLSFETDLLYLDVNNGRVGIRNGVPDYDLDITGTARTTNAIVDTQADIATFTILNNTISSTNSVINLEPNGSNAVVYQGRIVTGDLQLSTNIIETTALDSDLEINTLGTGQVNINSNVLVNGDIHATGTITADGNIQLGDADTDSITFNADVNSNIIPNLDATYDLGTNTPSVGFPDGKRWNITYTKDLIAETVTSDGILVDGIDLALVQGNIYYVATTGSDSNAGEHEHNPLLTVKYALSLASTGDTIYIFPGTYSEIFPLTVSAGITVKGAGIRSVTIQPTVGTVDKDAFLLNGETTIEDLTIAGFRFNAVNNTGYAFRFATGMTVTTRSPYIRNITVISRGSVTSPSDPYGFLQNDAGKGALVDGSVVSASSNQASMLFHSVTFFTPNQECITATNGVRIEWLNSFSYFADKGLYGVSGSTGFAGAGKTRLRIDSRTGTWAVGNTVTYYDTDGTSVLASGTIASIDGNYVNLTGRQLGFETITDRVGKTVYAQGDAKLSTAQKKFGTASLALDGTADYITVPNQPDFAYGTNDFTIEMWVYRTVSGITQVLLDQRTASPTNYAPVIFINTSNALQYNDGAASVITGATTVPLNAWSHVALSRSGTSTKLFLNGVQQGSTYTDTRNYIATPLTIGARFNNIQNFTGYIDEVRISKGIARYTANFTAPTTPFAGDLNTVLLLHFNGTNNSTTFIDDGITLQDLRTSAGGTASLINFADYSQFGAEIRSIGSAAVYGTYGAYGDGDGVLMYLISQNFAYIGADELTTNDPNDRIAANEVVKLNRAKIYYTSVDNEGNFSVGDAFFVNQATGDVLFNGESLSITTPAGITFTDGVNSTTITPTNIDTGNIRISGNTIESLTGDVNVTAASGIINLQNNTFITGNLDVTGDITLGGNITIGDANTDTINFVGGISSDLIPSVTATYNLGQGGVTPLRWNNVYLSRAEIDGVVIDSNTIETTTTDTDLTLQANGTGRIYVPSNDVQIAQNLTVTTDLTVTTGTTSLKAVDVVGTITQTGDFNQTGNFTTSGNTEVTGNITATGYLQLPQITITGNTVQTTVTDLDLQLTANGTGNVVFEGLEVQDNIIKSTVTNANVILTPQGTGSVVIDSNQSLIIPIGDNGDRPATPTNGMIRYNTDLDRYEGYNNGFWLTLSGVADSDGNTYISAELTPGANDNTLRFYADGNLMVTIDSTKLFAERLQTTNLDIQTDTISSISTDSDINLTAAGTGSVRVGNLSIRNNSITNVVSGAVTEFVETGTGYISISGTNGVVIPNGNDAGRPGIPELGMIRYNTQQGLVEVYNGVIWTSVAGTGGGITFNDATQIAIEYVLIFG
jgi:hypothetical protein